MVNHSPELFQRPLPSPSFRLLVIGDSQAAGVGTSSPEKSISGLFAAAYPDWSVETIARSGARLAEIGRMFDRARPPYDLILIFAGANDLIQMRPQFLIRRQLQSLIQVARPLAPHIAISHGGNLGLAPAFPRFIAPIFTRRAQTARRTYQAFTTKNNLIYLDFFNHPITGAGVHATDGLHLSDAGYAATFAYIQRTLLNHGVNL